MPAQAIDADQFMQCPIFEKAVFGMVSGEMVMLPTVDPVKLEICLHKNEWAMRYLNPASPPPSPASCGVPRWRWPSAMRSAFRPIPASVRGLRPVSGHFGAFGAGPGSDDRLAVAVVIPAVQSGPWQGPRHGEGSQGAARWLNGAYKCMRQGALHKRLAEG
jgi:hypothetical protein